MTSIIESSGAAILAIFALPLIIFTLAAILAGLEYISKKIFPFLAELLSAIYSGDDRPHSSPW